MFFYGLSRQSTSSTCQSMLTGSSNTLFTNKIIYRNKFVRSFTSRI